MKVDLHCHSYFSDGRHEPEFLLQRAQQNQVSHLAITDHDSVAAFDRIKDWRGAPVLIPGVEISCNWEASEVHIVGLGIDHRHPTLQQLLRSQQAARQQRATAMESGLVALGISGLGGYLAGLPCQAVTRSHVADFLVAAGVSRTRQKAFKKFLGRNGRVFVPGSWCAMENAVEVINVAGGIAVLAHPGRYALGRTGLARLLTDFADAGGEGIEASYGNIDAATRARLCQEASQRRLWISMGSDFHDADAHWTDIGRYPALDDGSIKNAIWRHPRWHF